MKRDLWLRIGCPNLTNNKVFLVAVFILSMFNIVLYFQNNHTKSKKIEEIKQQEVSYRLGPVFRTGLCQCIQTFDLRITEQGPNYLLL